MVVRVCSCHGFSEVYMNIIFRSSVVIVAFGVIPFFTSQAYAGYLDVSGGWDTVPGITIPMNQRKARNVAGKCRTVQAYENMSGTSSGAMIVAGVHKTQADHVDHLTVRLYKNGRHEKSCHVHVNSKSEYKDCSCNWN
jgi:hypothetical protein